MKKPRLIPVLKRFNSWLLGLLLLSLWPSALLAGLWTGSSVTITSSVSITSFSISNANPCPGDTVTITYCVLGTNPFYLPNSSVAVTLKDTGLPTTDFVEPSAVGQWMLWAQPGALNPPMTVWLYSSFGGGFNEGPLSTTCTVKTLTVTIPTNVNWGSTYNLIAAFGEGSNNVAIHGVLPRRTSPSPFVPLTQISAV